MILLDIKLNNIYGFKDFHMNFSYPKKIVNSVLENEYLDGHPNFRYKKAVILMGANATGKTTLGKALLAIFNFINSSNPFLLSKLTQIGTRGEFTIDFINLGTVLHRIKVDFLPQNEVLLQFNCFYSSTSIGSKDSYESCAERLTKKISESKNLDFDGVDAMSASIGKINYVFSCPEVKPSLRIAELNNKLTLKILKAVVGTLDPTLSNVEISRDLKNSFIIRRGDEEIIIQNGKLLNRSALSSGTAEGIDIAFFLSLLFAGENGFYYCDEHFSYIHSDIEKRIFGLMVDHLDSNEQLIFTTHNPDMLDLNLPKHSFAFLRKRAEDDYRITSMYASDILKRNTDSVHCALENDMFDSIPDDSLLNELDIV